MKHAIISTDLVESDIRPPGLRARFREVVLDEAPKYFPAESLAEIAACPACGSDDREHAFSKHGFDYDRCRVCGSAFARMRPTDEAVARFYRESEAGRMRTRYFTAGVGAEVSDVMRARVDWVWTFASGRPGLADLLDIGTSYSGVLTELTDLDAFGMVSSVRPNDSIVTDLVSHGVKILDELTPVGAITAFEQLEHQADPRAWIRSVGASLRPGGVLFLTTRSISGFDLQVLWDRSPYIFFPEHLNLFSIEGLQAWLEQGGFDIIELSTPGHLDVEFIRQAVIDDPSIELPRFVTSILERRGAHARREFQMYLQKTQLSSHVRVVAQWRNSVRD